MTYGRNDKSNQFTRRVLIAVSFLVFILSAHVVSRFVVLGALHPESSNLKCAGQQKQRQPLRRYAELSKAPPLVNLRAERVPQTGLVEPARLSKPDDVELESPFIRPPPTSGTFEVVP